MAGDMACMKVKEEVDNPRIKDWSLDSTEEVRRLSQTGLIVPMPKEKAGITMAN